MNNAQLKYKRETGNCHYMHIEPRIVVDAIDIRLFDGWTYKDIVNAIDSEIPSWGILIEELPREYDDNTDVFLPTPEYIEWLESQIEQL